MRLGATGLESDVWVTADDVAVLDHDGVIGRVRRRHIRDLRRDDLPDHIPALADLYDAVGGDLPLSLDVKDPAAVDATVAAAEAAGAVENLWLCHHDWRTVAQWRGRARGAHLVDSTRIDKMKEGPERRAVALVDAGILTLNMHHRDWSGGLVTMFHRFGIECFAWDLQQTRQIAALLEMGVDAVYSDHVDRLVDALPPPAEDQPD